MKMRKNIKCIFLLIICFAFILVFPVKVDALGAADCGVQLKMNGSGNSTKFIIDGKYAWCLNEGAKIKNSKGEPYYYYLTETSDDYFAKFVYSAYAKYGSGIYNTWDVYSAIRQVARTGSCSGEPCKTIKDEMNNNKCTVYYGKARYNDNKLGICVERNDAQNMYAVDCTLVPTTEEHKCEKVGNTYYGPNGEVLNSEAEFNQKCPGAHKCEKVGNTYYGPNGEELSSEADFNLKCNNPCKSTTTCCKYEGHFYVGGGEVGETEYKKSCPCDQDGCCKSGNTYYWNRSPVNIATYIANCCEEHYDKCCVLDGQYYLDPEGTKVDDKKKCLSCEPAVSYHSSCQLKDLDPMCDIEGYDGGETKGELLKTKFENKESINFITYKEVDDDDIIKCVLTKQTDYAENTLQNIKVIDPNNRYCKVFCKDDVGKFEDDGTLRSDPFPFGYSVSGMQEANSGRYFRLNAEFTSKRTCYTTSNDDDKETREINLDKFNEDVYTQVKIINDNINTMNDALATLTWLKTEEFKHDQNELSNGTDLCSPKDYIINSYYYTASAIANLSKYKYPKYEISLDNDTSTEHHLSFKVEEKGELTPSPTTSWTDTTYTFDSKPYDTTCWRPKYDAQWNYIGEESYPCQDTLDCYGSNYDAYEDYTDYVADIQSTYDTSNRNIENALKQIQAYIQEIEDCTINWPNEFNYKPESIITYKYGYAENGNNDGAYYDAIRDLDEGKYTKMERQDLAPISEEEKWTAKTTTYNDDGSWEWYISTNPQILPCVDDKYSDDRSGIKCYDEDGTDDSVTYITDIPQKGHYHSVTTNPQHFVNYTYMKKSIEQTYKFTSPNIFATLYPSGAVILRENYGGDFEKEEYVEFNGLPVQIETSNGPHKFTFNFSNIGEYFDREDSTGRIYDAEQNTNVETVLGKYNEKYSIFPLEQKDYNYVCYYRVNQTTCKTCEPTCDDDECTSTTEEECLGEDCCQYCNPVCVDCIYTSKEYQLDVSPIPVHTTSIPSGTSPSPGPGGNPTYNVISVVNPNGIEFVPYNWNWNTWATYDDYGQKYIILNEKAKLTIDEIQTYGELIYVSKDLGTNNDFEGSPVIEGIGSSSKDFGVLKVVMTPSLAQKIRDYNSREKSYTNSTLTCYDYVYGSTVFEKIFCYSSFLDEYVDDPNFTFSHSRIQDINARDNTANGDYWTTFLSQSSSSGERFGEKYGSAIVKIKDGDMEKIGGPAWK